MNRELAQFERWMMAELGAPLERSQRSTARSRRVAREVQPSATLSSHQRLDLYADMIRARFVECLQSDFPATERALGAPRFAELAGQFVERHPSRHFSLNVLGVEFPRFLESQPIARGAVHLARLERAVQDVFDAPRDELLSADELRALAPERWSSLQLRPIAALRIVEAPFAINAYLQSVLDGRAQPKLMRRASRTLVWRRNFVVWRRELDRDETRLLQLFSAGSTLSAALATVSPSRRTHIAAWFERWSADGLLRSLAER